MVQNTLESVNVKNVFSCGDVCHLDGNPRPKAGVFAVRAGYELRLQCSNDHKLISL